MVFERVPIVLLSRCKLQEFSSNYIKQHNNNNDGEEKMKALEDVTITTADQNRKCYENNDKNNDEYVDDDKHSNNNHIRSDSFDEMTMQRTNDVFSLHCLKDGLNGMHQRNDTSRSGAIQTRNCSRGRVIFKQASMTTNPTNIDSRVEEVVMADTPLLQLPTREKHVKNNGGNIEKVFGVAQPTNDSSTITSTSIEIDNNENNNKRKQTTTTTKGFTTKTSNSTHLFHHMQSQDNNELLSNDNIKKDPISDYKLMSELCEKINDLVYSAHPQLHVARQLKERMKLDGITEDDLENSCSNNLDTVTIVTTTTDGRTNSDDKMLCCEVLALSTTSRLENRQSLFQVTTKEDNDDDDVKDVYNFQQQQRFSSDNGQLHVSYQDDKVSNHHEKYRSSGMTDTSIMTDVDKWIPSKYSNKKECLKEQKVEKVTNGALHDDGDDENGLRSTSKDILIGTDDIAGDISSFNYFRSQHGSRRMSEPIQIGNGVEIPYSPFNLPSFELHHESSDKVEKVSRATLTSDLALCERRPKQEASSPQWRHRTVSLDSIQFHKQFKGLDKKPVKEISFKIKKVRAISVEKIRHNDKLLLHNGTDANMLTGFTDIRNNNGYVEKSHPSNPKVDHEAERSNMTFNKDILTSFYLNSTVKPPYGARKPIMPLEQKPFATNISSLYLENRNGITEGQAVDFNNNAPDDNGNGYTISSQETAHSLQDQEGLKKFDANNENNSPVTARKGILKTPYVEQNTMSARTRTKSIPLSQDDIRTRNQKSEDENYEKFLSFLPTTDNECGHDVTTDEQSSIYLGIASASSCQARRRRHSLDQIGRPLEKTVNRRILQDKSELTSTISDCEASQGHEQYSEFTPKKKSGSFPLSMPEITCPGKTSVEERTQRPSLNRSKSEDTQTSGIDTMRISEQDLGSDAESLPSCGESVTTSESPPNSPDLFKQKQEIGRRESAPASLNIEALKEIQLNSMNADKTREMHRRYSSVEERTSRVRFNLDKSFKEEEDRYNKQFDEKDEDELQRKFSDIEGYKVSAPSANSRRKVSSPPCLSCDIEEGKQTRKDSTDRSRKCSVYSDNSGSIQVLPGQSIRKVSSQEDLIREETEDEEETKHHNNRKISLQDTKSRNKEQKADTRKLSLQEKSTRRKSMCLDEKTSENTRKFSLQVPKRRPSFSDRKLSLQEKKQSNGERKVSFHDRKYSAHESVRKVSTERKYSSAERKLSSQETRKTSLSETFRSVVGTKKRSERKHSHETLADENNNLSGDKKSAWGLIKNKIKKERKSSNDMITNGSPRMMRILSRNDSNSSIESGTPRRNRRSDSTGKRSPRSEDYDQKSISSYNSVEMEETENHPDIVPRCAFDIWSEGQIDIEVDSPTLPLLHVAAGEGNRDLLKTLLEVGVDVNELDQCGWPALHYAVCAGHFECAELLMSKGATLKNYSNQVMNKYCSAVRDCIRTGNAYS